MKSERNKTLTISENEIPLLKESIITDVEQVTNWQNVLLNSDLFDVIDYIPNNSVDLIVLDPPYNLSRQFNTVEFKASSDKLYKEYLKTWFHKVIEKLKLDGTVYVCGDWKCSHVQKQVIEEEGLCVLNRITWQREKGRGAKSNWKNSMEDIWFAVKNPNNYYFNVDAVKVKRRVLASYRVDGDPKDWQETPEGKFRLTYPSNFWDDITIPFWSMPENTDHPTQKSEKLIAKLILASSKPEDVVFDPFAGSGTTLVTAKKLGRKYIGIEKDETYSLYAAKRLLNATEDKRIQGYEDGVFWERNSNPN